MECMERARIQASRSLEEIHMDAIPSCRSGAPAERDKRRRRLSRPIPRPRYSHRYPPCPEPSFDRRIAPASIPVHRAIPINATMTIRAAGRRQAQGLNAEETEWDIEDDICDHVGPVRPVAPGFEQSADRAMRARVPVDKWIERQVQDQRGDAGRDGRVFADLPEPAHAGPARMATSQRFRIMRCRR